jgi:Cu/Ag efflux protein CusF
MRGFLFLAFLSLPGCAAYRLAPLTTDHPAHPEATAAPERPVSNTLAHTQSDVPSPRSVSSLTVTEQEGHESHHQAESTPPKTVVGEGKVVATVPSANQLVVEHGEIKDFMGPMTMGYKIDSPSLLEGLKAGDKIRFTIDVQTKSIVKIQKLNP